MTEFAQTDPIPAQTPAVTGKEDSPLRLGASGWKQVVPRTLKEVKDDRITLIAAGIAFYWFLAVFPALIASVGIIDILDAGAGFVATIKQMINSALPGDAAKILVEAVADAGHPKERASIVAALIGIALALWSASAGMVALQTGLDVSYDVPVERRFVKKRLFGFALVGATFLFGGFAGSLFIFAEPITEWLKTNFGNDVVLQSWTLLRWTAALAGLTVLIAVFYYWGPNRTSPHWKWLTPGGIIATVGWLIASVGFRFYVRSFGSYAETYGSLAGVVVLILWLYLTSLVILVGAELNAELERQAAISDGQVTSAALPSDSTTATGKKSFLGRLLAGVLIAYASIGKRK